MNLLQKVTQRCCQFHTAASAAVILIAAAGFLILFMDQARLTAETIRPRETGKKNKVRISEPSPGWWNSSRRIYYEIPARIRFYLPGAENHTALKIAENVWDEFHRIGKIFNPSDADSETSKLNSADKTRPVRVSGEMFQVLRLCRLLWEKSGGAFDPTTTPIKKLWRRAEKNGQIPSKREIKSILERTGFGDVMLVPEKTAVLCQKKGIEFDFGGIAKGFAVDRAVKMLKKQGIKNGLVQLGGEIAAFGTNVKGEPWIIGIQHPTRLRKIWGTISARGAVRVSTSGNYRQPLRIQGQEFYHIFSPETGMPAPQKVLGATTADFKKDASSALLDGAATAITVMGAEKGLQLAGKLGIQSLVLSRQGQKDIEENVTGGLAEHFEKAVRQNP